MRILIAPNAFKNSLDAGSAAEAIRKGLLKSGHLCECFPVGDGGDGTSELLIKKLKGAAISVPVQDPLGRGIEANFGWIASEATAVIEMAQASGLRLLATDEHNPMQASSCGTGQLIRYALDKGARKILLAVGGTATVDGGSGILAALGAQFLDANGDQLPLAPKCLANLHRIDCSGLDPRLAACEIIILSDVRNRLLGTTGGVRVYGPQKGATETTLTLLEAALSRFRQVALDAGQMDMDSIERGGAAGGAVAGLCAFLKARAVDGIDYFLDATKFDESLAPAQLVITGEGSLDDQTLEGKAPLGVALRAHRLGIPVIGLAGKIPGTQLPALEPYFTALFSIAAGPGNLEESLLCTAANLERTANAIGHVLTLHQPAFSSTQIITNHHY
jgi:glycerate 2-kinase